MHLISCQNQHFLPINQYILTLVRIVIALRVRGHFQRCENFRIDEEIVLISRRVFYHPPCCNIPNNPPPYRLRTFKQLLKSLIHKINALFVVMGSSWNFPARASSSYESSEPSRAELGHFNFRAETELTIHTICMSKNSKFFPHAKN